ncbi:MAG: hypothetical protein OQK75_09370 [Gammaproteobacteria bacterium]|nr:hypothetical protein [Gammaproteobacteria bacterium]
MNNASLALTQSPPLFVPLRFFLTAPLFVIACGIVLFWSGPEAFTNRWHPSLLAATHFITLGFLAMIMLGALQQLTPVLMGAQIPRSNLFSRVTHLLLTTGTLSLTAGWLLQQPQLFTVAAVLLSLAIILFTLVLLIVLLKARSGYATVYSTRIALLAFAITMILGVYLAMGYGGFEINRLPGMTSLHMSWGLIGWVSLLIMGVAFQVVPMFQITPDYPTPMMRWLVILMFVILVCWSIVQILFAERASLLNVFSALLALGLLSFLVTTLKLLARRRRNIPDITLNFWRVAMSSLLITLIAWLLSLFNLHPRLDFFIVVLMIIGFAVSAVSGMLYKIVPFLIWLHLNTYAQGKDRSKFKIPNMKQVIPEGKARLHFKVHNLMLVCSAVAVFWPEYFLRPATLLLIVTAIILFNNIFFALRVYNYHSSR